MRTRICGVRPLGPPSAVLAVLLGLLIHASPALAQVEPQSSRPSIRSEPQSAAPSSSPEPFDLIDLLRKIRHKTMTPEQQAAASDLSRRMYAVAPVIGYKPSSGVMIGVAGNIAYFRGEPATTHISSTVASLTVSSLKQTSLSARFSAFGRADRWALDGDNRAQWTSQDTYGLGTATAPDDEVNMKFDYFRLYNTALYKVGRRLFAGVGLHYSAHTQVEPGRDAEAGWSDSPYVTYSQTRGLPLDSQTSAGVSLSLRADARDSAINAGRGWLASVSYRPFFKGFLGGSTSWQELYVDGRTYKALDAGGRHKLAFWLWGDFAAAGVAPYLDLPAIGADKYGRSGRGYAEGRFRGERLVYGEIEYRATLTSNRLVGMVVFLNMTTLSNLESGERLFDNFAPGTGAGLRLLLNKRSNTNLCFDIGFGKQGSRGVYLAVEEAF
jgi:outer membrane protein assembly factor BamA